MELPLGSPAPSARLAGPALCSSIYCSADAGAEQDAHQEEGRHCATTARPPPSRPGRSCSLGRPTSSSRRTSSAPSSPSSPSPPRSCSCSPPPPLPLPARARAAPRRPVGRSSSIAPCRTHCRSSSPTTSSSAAPPGRTGTGRGGSPRWCCTGTCASPSGQGVRGARRVRQVPPRRSLFL